MVERFEKLMALLFPHFKKSTCLHQLYEEEDEDEDLAEGCGVVCLDVCLLLICRRRRRPSGQLWCVLPLTKQRPYIFFFAPNNEGVI